MNRKQIQHVKNTLQHLYINPLEMCNLQCKICYTRKTSPILSETEINNFIQRYNKKVQLKVVTFCGGEVFTLPYFTRIVNELTQKGIYVQIITNGIINRLNDCINPNLINLIVSIDGLEFYHDLNRGKGNFQKSIDYIHDAIKKGFHTEIFSIVTKQNYPHIDQFEISMFQLFGNIEITYHPRKPMRYLLDHPFSNIRGDIKGFDFLSDDEVRKLTIAKKVFPSATLGCYQISLASDGTIYGCCEGFIPLGKISDPISSLITNLKKNITGPCLGCSQPNFMCGIKDIIIIK